MKYSLKAAGLNSGTHDVRVRERENQGAKLYETIGYQEALRNDRADYQDIKVQQNQNTKDKVQCKEKKQK